ncbi:hypothetical protein KL930_005219 [Ogataea haglerorum]|nr:hypothetical protein KL930_005219 [Ogataea haglerorum]KAG7773928.1 hypothetical protein KL922_005100 [Ogataea haglerorum]
MFETPLPPRKSAFPTPPSTQNRPGTYSGDAGLPDAGLNQFADDSFHESELRVGQNLLNADDSPVSRKRRLEEPQSEQPSKLRAGSEKEQEKWPQDVEEAFEQALRIIPKHGLHKIKINGRACGRNELISDYIYAKTGKVRSRKQVSSHIQVVKNIKKRPELTKLILEGPPCDEETKRLFDQEFSRISMAKMAAADKSPGSSKVQTIRYPLTPIHPNNSVQRQQLSLADLFRIDLTLRKFIMNYVDFEEPENSHKFTSLSEDYYQPPLRIRTNADLSHRFPQLFELIDQIKAQTPSSPSTQMHSTLPPVPLLHAMVKMVAPAENHDTSAGHFNVNSSLQLHGIPATDRKYVCLTLIYSYGRTIVTTLEKLETKVVRKQGPHKDVALEIRLGTNYWADFFASIRRLMRAPETKDIRKDLLTRAVKGITMKQVIVNVNDENELVAETKPRISLDHVRKDNVRAIILWEFLKVDDYNEAKTTIRRLHLPLREPAQAVQLPEPEPEPEPEPSLHHDINFSHALPDFHEADPFLSLNTLNNNDTQLDENYSYLW